jgi:hypothetical protein
MARCRYSGGPRGDRIGGERRAIQSGLEHKKMSAVATLEGELEAALNDLLDEGVAGAISSTDIQGLEVCRALCELAIMAAAAWDAPPRSATERMSRDQAVIAMWPEACRRSNSPVKDAPSNFLLRRRPELEIGG